MNSHYARYIPGTWYVVQSTMFFNLFTLESWGSRHNLLRQPFLSHEWTVPSGLNREAFGLDRLLARSLPLCGEDAALVFILELYDNNAEIFSGNSQFLLGETVLVVAPSDPSPPLPKGSVDTEL